MEKEGSLMASLGFLDFLVMQTLSQFKLSTCHSKQRVSANRTSSCILIEFRNVIWESMCSVYTAYREMNFEGWQWAPSSRVRLDPHSPFHCVPVAPFLWSSSFSSLDIPNDKLLEGISLHANTCVSLLFFSLSVEKKWSWCDSKWMLANYQVTGVKFYEMRIPEECGNKSSTVVQFGRVITKI